jgi:hypothetical protein
MLPQVHFESQYDKLPAALTLAVQEPGGSGHRFRSFLR